MTDESSAPPAPDPGVPSTTPRPAAGPLPPRGTRPPATRKSASPPPKKDNPNLKKYLVLGIIIATVVLVPLVGWRLYVKLSAQKGPPPRNVAAEWNDAWDKADKAWKETFKVQAKVWTADENLKPEDIEKLKQTLATYQKTSEVFHDLNAVMVKQGKTDSREYNDIGAKLVTLKTWIYDTNGMLDPANVPPKYGGLYIPMYQAEKRMGAATKRLLEIKGQTQEILARKDLEEIKAVIKEIRSLRETLAAVRDEFLRLDDELLKGLTLPDLKEDQLPELRDLRDYTSKSIMAFKEAGQIRSEFPSEEELNAPPKPETPKEEPPKETPKDQPPPKEEPPKEQPPKEDPPKEQPPKEEPKKDEPKKEEPPKETPK